MDDTEASVLQKTFEKILEKEGAVISDVRIIPDRRPAGVQLDLAVLHGLELFEFMAKSISKKNQLKDFLGRLIALTREIKQVQLENGFTKLSANECADKISKDNYFEIMFRLVILLYSS